MESIKINPRYAKAHNNLGVLYEELGETNKAIESYKTASKINPNDPDSFYNLGLAYDNLGDGENSVEYMVLAKKAQEKKITKVYFDRGRYKYHGRIKIFADTLRKNGLNF